MVFRRRPLAALGLALTALLTIPTSARAEQATAARAQALFDEALALMKAGNYAEACPKLEESDRLDPGMGTEYRLAECYESAGKIVHAWSLFRAVADAAQRDGKGDRAALAIRRAADLAPRLPMVLVKVPESSSVPGLSVQIDDKPLAPSDWGQKVPLDPGEHLISAKAPGKVGWARAITSVESTTTVVIVPAFGDGLAALPPALPPSALASKAPEPASEGLSTPRLAALIAGGVGLAGIAVGTGLGLRAGSQWRSAKAQCLDPEAGTGCSPAGIASGKDAYGSAAVSTIGFVVGGAALLTGGLLWFRFAPSKQASPASSFVLAPSFGPGAGAARLEGSF
jgi:hypothetical protein